MKRLFLTTLILMLTASVGHAVDNLVVVDGVTYEWSQQDLAYIVTGYDSDASLQSLHIRSVVNGLDVIAIDDFAFEDKTDIIYLTIDEGITRIGDNAFCRCSNMQVARLPEGLTFIGEEAFAFCSSLSIMVIPSTVVEIQAQAFMGCTGVTDVYFLMDTQAQLDDFGWWDGVYTKPGEEVHGGREFNTNQNTVVHVPAGTYNMYDDSGKLEAWLFQADNVAYPLWWIVNYGVVGRVYTVSDDLTAVYVDINGDLYAKDDNFWLTPDVSYSGEIDYISNNTNLMKYRNDHYDQSNWVQLINVDDPDEFVDHLIDGGTITGTLLDKKNPKIAVSSEATLVRGDECGYVKNTYLLAAFMSRTQKGKNGRVYAFVQPKPQELLHIEWAIYSDQDGNFYLPAPDDGINSAEIAGGVVPNYDLYEDSPVPQLYDCAIYDFDAINRRRVVGNGSQDSPRRLNSYTPYEDGGVSETFIAYPLELPSIPIHTAITDLTIPNAKNSLRYNVLGQPVGNDYKGIVIENGKKVLVK